jgi:hypothetical protein
MRTVSTTAQNNKGKDKTGRKNNELHKNLGKTS